MSTARKCKTKYLAKSAFIYFSVSFGLIFGAKLIFAQETTRSITIVPPSNEFKVNPGDKQEGTLKVVNNSNAPLTFSAVVRDFVVEDTIGTPKLLADDTLSKKYSAASWVAVSPSSFTIPAGKTQILNYYLQVPIDARPGGHYAGIVYEPQELLGVKGTGTGVQTHLGTLYYVTVSGQIVENATVKKFAPEHTFLEYGPATILTQIHNSSDTHIRPTGFVNVKNLIGQTIFSEKFEEHNIFPEASRDFTTKIGKKLMFGLYTVELKTTYGANNNLTLFASTHFIVFPWKIATVVALAIAVGILLVVFMKKRKKRSSDIPPAPQPQSLPQNPVV